MGFILEPSGGTIPSLSHQKEKLERQKARLQSQEQKLKLLERKKRTRRLIELGGLIVKAELDALKNNTLLGALQSLKSSIEKNETLIHEWTEQGGVHIIHDVYSLNGTFCLLMRQRLTFLNI
jgi:hypothetical protein